MKENFHRLPKKYGYFCLYLLYFLKTKLYYSIPVHIFSNTLLIKDTCVKVNYKTKAGQLPFLSLKSLLFLYFGSGKLFSLQKNIKDFHKLQSQFYVVVSQSWIVLCNCFWYMLFKFNIDCYPHMFYPLEARFILSASTKLRFLAFNMEREYTHLLLSWACCQKHRWTHLCHSTHQNLLKSNEFTRCGCFLFTTCHIVLISSIVYKGKQRFFDYNLKH